jgi:hypothetical protein
MYTVSILMLLRSRIRNAQVRYSQWDIPDATVSNFFVGMPPRLLNANYPSNGGYQPCFELCSYRCCIHEVLYFWHISGLLHWGFVSSSVGPEYYVAILSFVVCHIFAPLNLLAVQCRQCEQARGSYGQGQLLRACLRNGVSVVPGSW